MSDQEQNIYKFSLLVFLVTVILHLTFLLPLPDLSRLSFLLMFRFASNSFHIFALPHHIIAKHLGQDV